MRNPSKSLLLPFLILLVTACSSQKVYEEESFADDSPFRQKVDGEAADVCESARRSLLGQGYLIDTATGEELKARKATKGGDSQNTFIEMNIVCLPESDGSTLFATGLLSEYALKKNSSSASVGVSAIGSISLPIGQSADSLVKVSEETIDNKAFYQRFFAAVSTNLAQMQAGKPTVYAVDSAEPAAEAPEQLEPSAMDESAVENAPLVAEPEANDAETEQAATPAEPVEPVEPAEPVDPIEPESTYTSEPLPSEEAPQEAAAVIPPGAIRADEMPEMTIEQILELEQEPSTAETAPAANSEPEPETEAASTIAQEEPEPTPKSKPSEDYYDNLDELF